MSEQPISFSIVVPTKNRPQLLKRALESIVEQSYQNYEVIVVDDASNEECARAIDEIISGLGSRFSVCRRPASAQRHGPNTARNAGFDKARGSYIGYLDDDDFWCDKDHLLVASQAIAEVEGLDFFLGDQIARRGEKVVVSEWLPYLNRVINSREKLTGSDCYKVSVDDVLQPEGIGFPHVNTVFIKAQLVAETQGFWDGAPYEGDLNFFVRLLSLVETIVYRPVQVGINELRNNPLEGGVSSLDQQSKLLFRMLVCEHAALHSTGKARVYAKLLQSGVMKTLSKQLYEQKRYRMASEHSTRAFVLSPCVRWGSIALWLKVRALFSAA